MNPKKTLTELAADVEAAVVLLREAEAAEMKAFGHQTYDYFAVEAAQKAYEAAAAMAKEANALLVAAIEEEMP